MSKPTSYSDAIEELEDIVRDIGQESISLDQLSTKVKRASELIRFCKKQLHTTEAEVEKVLKELQPEAPKPDTSAPTDEPF